jgi:hypothetical protein
MKSGRHSLVKTFGVATCTLALLLMTGMLSWACDVAVVASWASPTGRPFIWKNYDSSESIQQQVKHFPAVGNGGSYLLLHHLDSVTQERSGDSRCPQGGVNEEGFAMACTSVYEDTSNFVNETRNMNVTFMMQAIQRCVTLADFESFIKTWPASNTARTISGNFVALDAKGGAALYELYTGRATVNGTPYIQMRKFNANNGVVTTDTGSTYTVANSGWFVRTNSHTWIPNNPGQERLAMATARITSLRSSNQLTPRNMMLTVSKDLTQGKVLSSSSSTATNWSTTYCVSRSATRSGLVVDGVENGYDPSLTTFWVCMGEPTIGVFVPYFPAAGAVSPYVYMDAISSTGAMTDTSDTCLLAMAEDYRETYNGLIYNSNRGSVIFGPNDTTINKTNLNTALSWIKPIETTIYTNADSFLNTLRGESSLVTAANLLGFSNYCAKYAYDNYTHASSTYSPWNYAGPGGGGDIPTTRTTRTTRSTQPIRCLPPGCRSRGPFCSVLHPSRSATRARRRLRAGR